MSSEERGGLSTAQEIKIFPRSCSGHQSLSELVRTVFDRRPVSMEEIASHFFIIISFLCPLRVLSLDCFIWPNLHKAPGVRNWNKSLWKDVENEEITEDGSQFSTTKMTVVKIGIYNCFKNVKRNFYCCHHSFKKFRILEIFLWYNYISTPPYIDAHTNFKYI